MAQAGKSSGDEVNRELEHVPSGRQETFEAQADWLPVVEVSDEDYRSFCWPCYDLEDLDGLGGLESAASEEGDGRVD